MRKSLLAVLAILSFSAPTFSQEGWDRTHEVCNLNGANGAACVGLSAYYRLDEPADYLRVSQVGGALSECPGTDVSTTTTTKFGQVRTASFDGSNSKGFIIPGGGGFGSGTWTVAVWVYPTSAAATSTVLTTMDTDSGKEGLALDLYYTGSALHARARSYMQDTDTLLTSENTTNITANAWHLVVFQSGHSTIRKLYSTQALKVSVDNGTFTSAAWTNAPRANARGNLAIGKSDSSIDGQTGACSRAGASGFTGYMQALSIYGRMLSPNDVALLWNGGAGRDFPF